DGRAAIVRIEQAVNLRTAGFHQLSHAFLGDPFFLHLGCKLARDHGLDRSSGNILAHTFLIEPALEARPYVRVFSHHDCTSFNLCFARPKSPAGAFRAFLMMAWSAISI